MVSSNFEDYEVLSILGADLNSTCYKVKNRATSKIFVWKAISCDNLTESGKQLLLAQIEQQKLTDHPHLVRVYDYIVQEETQIIYLVNEFCANGNLTGLIHKCLIENEHLHENFLWRVLYQIACALKIRGSLSPILNLSNIFVDSNFTVKIFNNDALKPELQNCENEMENVNLGHIMFELCTLQFQKFNGKNLVSTIKQILTDIPNYYSNEFKEIIRFTFSPDLDLKAMVDAVLCHPTILLKSTQTTTDIFVKNPLRKNLQQLNESDENITNIQLEAAHQLRLENLRNRETALKVREERLTMKEHELHKREKKVALLERTVKDKMLQAELYLKRCRETRSTSSGSNKSGSTKPKLPNYEHIDTSFSADCGDSSIIMPTSRKLNCGNVRKPSNFLRTLSERRVQFKGHSPLKDMFGRNCSKEPRILLQQSLHNVTVHETSSTASSETMVGNFVKPSVSPKKGKSKKRLDLSSVFPARNRRPLVERNVIYEENEAKEEIGYRPISWTEESKQHAFDLLRIMNKNNENEPIKHTYL